MVTPIPLIAVRPADAAADAEGLDRAGATASNIIPFIRPPRRDAEQADPRSMLPPADRLVPEPPQDKWRTRLAVLVVVSLLLHAGLFVFLHYGTEPLPSVELPAISVEIIVGDKARPDAGPTALKEEPKQPVTEEQKPPVAEESKPPVVQEAKPPAAEEPKPPAAEEPKPPVAEVARPPAAEEPKSPAAAEPKPPAAEESQSPAAEESKPAEEPAAAKAEEPPESQPPTPIEPAAPVTTAKPPEPRRPPQEHQTQPPAPPAKPKEPAREHKRPVEAPNGKRAPAAERASQPAETRQRASQQGSAPANDPNYRGIVFARLARTQHYPDAARANHSQGVATVSFVITASGQVGSVRLVRSSGVAILDQEAESMPRKASPFPPPPGGRAMSFTAPVSFHMR